MLLPGIKLGKFLGKSTILSTHNATRGYVQKTPFPLEFSNKVFKNSDDLPVPVPDFKKKILLEFCEFCLKKIYFMIISMGRIVFSSYYYCNLSRE